jgi:hypothetical protein
VFGLPAPSRTHPNALRITLLVTSLSPLQFLQFTRFDLHVVICSLRRLGTFVLFTTLALTFLPYSVSPPDHPLVVTVTFFFVRIPAGPPFTGIPRPSPARLTSFRSRKKTARPLCDPEQYDFGGSLRFDNHKSPTLLCCVFEIGRRVNLGRH